MERYIYNSSKVILAELLLSLFLFSSNLTYAQLQTTLGISAGYGLLNMSEVNNDLNDTYQALQSVNIRASSPEEIKGGLFLDGNLIFISDKLIFGCAVNYLTSSGDLSYTDASGSLEEKYNVSTIEILGIIGTNIPLNHITSVSFRGYAGYGLASVNHIGSVNFFMSPGNNIDIKNDVSGGYFSARLQGGFDFLFDSVILNVSIAYRIANAGALEGPMTKNGQSMGDQTVKNSRGGDINFDLSGIIFLAGLSFNL